MTIHRFFSSDFAGSVVFRLNEQHKMSTFDGFRGNVQTGPEAGDEGRTFLIGFPLMMSERKLCTHLNGNICLKLLIFPPRIKRLYDECTFHMRKKLSFEALMTHELYTW